MSVEIDVQFATQESALPTVADIERWAAGGLIDKPAAEITVRIVDEAESARLNETYRKKTGPTNVLAFPADIPEVAGLSLLGDIVICAPVVIAQAREQGKSAPAHWAHLIVHGILHLQGFIHENATDAAAMECAEVDILARLGYSNPYQAIK